MYNLGIDFGNSYVSVSAFIDGDADILELCDKGSVNGQYTMPVSMYLDEEMGMILGAEAEKKRQIDPLRYRNNFKKDLGSKVPYFIAGKEIHPDYLCKEVLKYIRDKAVCKYGADIGKAVITYPASFPIYKIDLLKRAAVMAGFEQVELVDDAAAATAYICFEKNYPIGSVFLVYDLGGTGFNLTLKIYDPTGFRNIVPPISVDFCGGFDFQRKLFDDIAAKNLKVYERALVKNDIRVIAAMEDLAEKLKFRLDAEDNEEIKVEIAVGLELISYHISRSEFESLTDEYVSTTVRLINQMLKKAKLSEDMIKAVIFIGGTTKMPYIRKRICGLLGKPVVNSDFPQMLASMGAALIASGTDFFAKKVVDEVRPVKIGSYIQLGEYGGEKILWQVVNRNDQCYTAIAVNVLCFKAFDAFGEDALFHQSKGEQEYGSGVWEYSALRQWLNSSDKHVKYSHLPPDGNQVWFNAYAEEPGFLSNFDEMERKILIGRPRKVLLPYGQGDAGTEPHQYSTQIAQALANYDAAYSKEVIDIVSLPSIKMIIENMVNAGLEYTAMPTETAVKICEGTFGEEFHTEKPCSYWLDTPCSSYPETVRIVSGSGNIDKKEACDGTVGVRPVIYMNQKIYTAAGEGTLENPYKVIL